MGNSDAASWKLIQVGVVVKDVKRVTERLAFLGIGPFKEMKLPPDRKELFRGKPALADAKIMAATLGETQLELVEPLAAESPHREFLETKGEGIQHFMVTVDDIEKEIKRLTDKGCTVLLDIRMPGGIHGAYIDLHAGGIIVEMFQTEPFATKLPTDLTAQLDAVCKRLGLRKNFVLEAALREKLEDLVDAADLRLAMKEATGFHAWDDVKRESFRKRGKRGL